MRKTGKSYSKKLAATLKLHSPIPFPVWRLRYLEMFRFVGRQQALAVVKSK